MTSQRHTPSLAVSPPGELPESVHTAVRDAVLAVGVRRTTLTDVARRAGVSRMTLYRLVPDVETLVLHVMSAEFAALLARAERATGRRRSARARLVAGVVEVVRALPAEPLFTRVLDVDPDLLLPFVTDRLGTTQRIALAHVRRMLAEGHADGSVRRGDLDTQALALLLTCTPFVLSARVMDGVTAGVRVDRESALRELAVILDRGLAP